MAVFFIVPYHQQLSFIRPDQCQLYEHQGTWRNLTDLQFFMACTFYLTMTFILLRLLLFKRIFDLFEYRIARVGS